MILTVQTVRICSVFPNPLKKQVGDKFIFVGHILAKFYGGVYSGT